MPKEVGPPTDDDSVSSAVTLDNMESTERVMSKETTYYDVLMGGANKVKDAPSTCSGLSDAAVASDDSMKSYNA
jgi:hypothetical protein